MTSALAYNFEASKAEIKEARFRMLYHLIQKYDYVCAQETHLAPGDTFSLNHPLWDTYRNNHPFCKKAGTVIFVSKRARDRNVSITHQIHQRGYIHSITVTHNDDPTKQARYTNFYGKTEKVDKYAKLADQIQILTALPEMTHDHFCGDWNFKTHQYQQSSKFQPPPVKFMEFWKAFLDTHSLKVIKSDIHTHIHSSGSTHQLDRFYTNMTEVELTALTPVVNVVYKNGSGKLSDHLPVSLIFI
jgi:hypothetical protein